MKPASALRLLRLAPYSGRSRLRPHRRSGAPGRRTRIRSISTRRARRSAATEIGAQGQEPHRRRSLQSCKPENDALGLALQGAIADLTPRLAAADQAPRGADAQSGRGRAHDRRRGQGAREREKAARHARRQPARRSRHAAARPTTSRPASARRGGNCSRARPSPGRRAFSIPQLWAAVWREVPIDAEVMRSLIGNWLDAVGERLTLRAEDRHGGGRARARAGRRAASLARAPGRLSRSRRSAAEPAPPRARRRLDLLRPGGAAARRPRPAGERARRLRPFRSAASRASSTRRSTPRGR